MKLVGLKIGRWKKIYKSTHDQLLCLVALLTIVVTFCLLMTLMGQEWVGYAVACSVMVVMTAVSAKDIYKTDKIRHLKEMGLIETAKFKESKTHDSK